MLFLVFLFLLALSLAYYVAFLYTVQQGLKRCHHSSSGTSRPFVSVVLAARNEEQNIRACVHSLVEQTYPFSQFEIIIVDDGSTDRTTNIVEKLSSARTTKNIQLIRLNDSPISRGKAYAIATGIEQARGEIILCTDADCTVPGEWIQSMVGCFENDVMFVAAPVTEKPDHTLFSKLSSLEFLGIITTAAGLIGASKPIFCNGANIAYKKSAFLAVSGYGNDATSCDDETLLQRIAVRNIGSIVFNADSNAIVVTNGTKSILEFWKQRVRWAAKKGHYEDNSILWKLIALNSFFIVLFALTVASLFEPYLFPLLLVGFLVKCVVDFRTLTLGAAMHRQTISKFHFAIAELLHVPYIVFAALIAQFGTIHWKERTFTR